MASRAAFEAILLVLAWAAALAVRPWRLLAPHAGQVPLATPLLAALAILPLLWAWPALASLPLPMRWSAAPLVVLLLGWPLAIPVVTIAGLSTLLTSGTDWPQALSLTVWAGVLPATATLLLGHAVRLGFGPHPVAYMLGRAFLVPMVALAACGLGSVAVGPGWNGAMGDLQRIAVALLAMGEAAWSCAIVSLLVAYRPQWLATWSETLYLGRPVRVRADTRTLRRR